MILFKINKYSQIKLTFKNIKIIKISNIATLQKMNTF